MKKLLIALAIALLVAGTGYWLTRLDGGRSSHIGGIAKPYSHEAFEDWLVADPSRQAEFEALVHFLASHEVGNVVPIWQLARTDSNLSKKCDRPEFLLPPRDEWGTIVPVLALVRDAIKPEIGEVEVVSSYRTPEFNTCIGGASQSQHLSFAALDLVAIDPISNDELFGELCAIQKRLGPVSKFGLGAYFDPAKPSKASGRFHVDVSGYRSWGYSQSADSSGCRAF